MPLILHRFGYSASPWRLAWQAVPGGPVREIRHQGLWWARKRDGLLILAPLQALGLDWEAQAHWEPTAQARVWAIVQPLVAAEEAQILAWHEKAVGVARND